MKTKKNLTFGIVFIFIVIGLAGCLKDNESDNKVDSRFVGEWRDEDGSLHYFKSNGSLYIDLHISSGDYIYFGNWEVKGDQIYIRNKDLGESYSSFNFVNDGNKLYIYNNESALYNILTKKDETTGNFIYDTPNIVGTINSANSNITITLVGEFLDYNDAKITVIGPDDIDHSDNLLDGMEEKLNNCYLKWVDVNADSKIGDEDKVYIYNNTGLDRGLWTVKIIQKSTGKTAYDSDKIMP